MLAKSANITLYKRTVPKSYANSCVVLALCRIDGPTNH